MKIVRKIEYNKLDVKRMISLLYQQRFDRVGPKKAIHGLVTAFSSLPEKEKINLAEETMNSIQFIQHLYGI